MELCENCKYRRRTEKYSRDFLCDNENSDFYRFYITADNSCELWTDTKAKKPKKEKVVKVKPKKKKAITKKSIKQKTARKKTVTDKPKRLYIRAGQTANWREYHTRYTRERYQQRKAKGLCVICGVPLEDAEHTKCHECRGKYRNWQRKHRNRES